MIWTKVFGGGPPWLDWGDNGKSVQLRRKDGTETNAVLFYDDWDEDSDGDEYPIWLARLPDGTQTYLVEFEEWVFAT